MPHHREVPGRSHGVCNLKLRLNPKTMVVPVVFHNLHGYDSHLLMHAISKVEGIVSCIPNNTEKYISLSLWQLRFIDSAQFLIASLDKLEAANRPETFQITAQYEPNEARRKLIIRKGVYLYEYMDSWARFEETQLPPKEAFCSKLADENINEADYAHAPQVWTTFGCKTLGDYIDLYCRTDSCYWQMSLRCSGRCASASTVWTRSQASAGTPYSRRQEWGSSCSKTTTSTCSSRRGCVEASQWSQSAMPKPTILWSRATTQKSLVATSSTWTRITSMAGR